MILIMMATVTMAFHIVTGTVLMINEGENRLGHSSNPNSELIGQLYRNGDVSAR